MLESELEQVRVIPAKAGIRGMMNDELRTMKGMKGIIGSVSAGI